MRGEVPAPEHDAALAPADSVSRFGRALPTLLAEKDVLEEIAGGGGGLSKNSMSPPEPERDVERNFFVDGSISIYDLNRTSECSIPDDGPDAKPDLQIFRISF